MAFGTTVEMKMEEQAKLGMFFLHEKIGLNKSKSLQEQGFEVTDSKEVNYFPRLHRISWENVKVECEDISLLDENSSELTFAQKLFVISMKNKPKSTKVS